MNRENSLRNRFDPLPSSQVTAVPFSGFLSQVAKVFTYIRWRPPGRLREVAYMTAFHSPAWPERFGRVARKALLLSIAIICPVAANALVDGPLAAKVTVTPIDSYSG